MRLPCRWGKLSLKFRDSMRHSSFNSTTHVISAITKIRPCILCWGNIFTLATVYLLLQIRFSTPWKCWGIKKKYVSLSWENEVVSNKVFFRNILFRTCDILKIRGQKRKVHLENFQETRKYQKSFFFFGKIGFPEIGHFSVCLLLQIWYCIFSLKIFGGREKHTHLWIAQIIYKVFAVTLKKAWTLAYKVVSRKHTHTHTHTHAPTHTHTHTHLHIHMYKHAAWPSKWRIS